MFPAEERASAKAGTDLYFQGQWGATGGSEAEERHALTWFSKVHSGAG